VTKFIDKSKVSDEGWLTDPTTLARSPMEAALLSTLSHENIVTVLDVFENVTTVQMVMEKHGAGMDLFEFIDRAPRTDEFITSYIFRQVSEQRSLSYSFVSRVFNLNFTLVSCFAANHQLSRLGLNGSR
jgi:serine/threonine protein kinase